MIAYSIIGTFEISKIKVENYHQPSMLKKIEFSIIAISNHINSTHHLSLNDDKKPSFHHNINQ
jgi:hypothetical protein